MRSCTQCGAPEGVYVRRLWEDTLKWEAVLGPMNTSTAWTMSVPVALHNGLCQTCNRIKNAPPVKR